MSLNAAAFVAWAISNQAREQIENFEIVNRAYAEVFSSYAGRIVLADLVLSEGLMRNSFEAGMNPNDAIYRDGRKAVVSDILDRALTQDILKFLSNQNGDNEEDDRQQSEPELG
jgi:hypothetical protein